MCPVYACTYLSHGLCNHLGASHYSTFCTAYDDTCSVVLGQSVTFLHTNLTGKDRHVAYAKQVVH